MHDASEIICHCFQHTRRDIVQDVLQNGRSRILEEIMAAKRLGQCHCALKNPTGS